MTIRSSKSFTLPEGADNLDLRTHVNWRYGRGNSSDNIITAIGGTQALDGLGGNDTLTGGADADTFNFGLEPGHDTITDFEPGIDRIILWEPSIATYADLAERMVQTGDDVRIDVAAGRTITLQGVSVADLTAADFGLGTELPRMVATFAEEFSSFDASGDGKWLSGGGRGSPHEIWFRSQPNVQQIYVDRDYAGTGDIPLGLDPFSLDDGVLTITARQTPEELVDLLHGKSWVSGRLTSYGSFSQQYGYFEMRAELPAGQGFWPAFWLVPEDRSWPPEIDIFEMLGKEPFVIRNSVASEYWGYTLAEGEYSLVPDTSQGFHTYGMLWSPQTIAFLVDGRTLFSVPTPADMHKKMSIIANLAVGGNWGGETDATTPEQGEMAIDYIRAYRVPAFDSMPRATGVTDMVDMINGVLRKSVSAPYEVYGDDVVRLGTSTANYRVAGSETVVGNALRNVLTGNNAATTLNGGANDDTLLGFGGDDVLLGEAGNDRIVGGAGIDHVVGGPGNDIYEFAPGDGGAESNDEIIVERIDEGRDTIRFTGGIRPDDVRMWIDVARLHIAVTSASHGTEYLSVKLSFDQAGHAIGRYVEAIAFGDGTRWSLTGPVRLSDTDDSHASSGTAAGDTILGNGGNDRLAGLDGNDILDGGDGTDMLYGGRGNDVLSDSGSGGADELVGEAGRDRLTGGAGQDHLKGGRGQRPAYCQRRRRLARRRGGGRHAGRRGKSRRLRLRRRRPWVGDRPDRRLQQRVRQDRDRRRDVRAVAR